MKIRQSFCLLLLLLPSCLLLGACGNLGYYTQSVGGQLDVWRHERSIDEVLQDATTDPAIKTKLQAVLAARDFASNTLLLPANDSYRSYADIGRPYVVWNVFAAPALSLEARKWCFVFLGCVSYRGYFEEEAAQAYATELAAAGLDVHVAGITAYSTLGWFDDPLLNTVISRPDAELAGLIFHELAHQKLYIKDDSTFNESFATFVELEGIRRWLKHQGKTQEVAAYQQRHQRRQQFVHLLMATRKKLQALYDSDQSDTSKLKAKAEILSGLRRDYDKLKASWGGYARFDAWFDKPVNNARLSAIGTYHEHVGAFRVLLKEQKNDLAKFYAAAAVIGNAGQKKRSWEIAALKRRGKEVNARLGD